MPQPQRTVKLQVKVDAPGVKEALDTIQKSLGGINKNVKNLSGNLGFLTNAFRGWIGYLGVRELTQMSDSMQNMFNRLKLITGSTEEATKVMGDLAAMADRTNQSISGVGEVYNRLALSLKGAKATNSELIALTETLINTFRVAGTTTTETVNTIIQLSQAFSSGQLRGQELRSVMEQNATLAGLLKERFGQDIYKKAEQGAISVAEVLGVLADNAYKVNEQAKQLAPTFEQVLTKSMNTLTLKVGELNLKFALSQKFAKVMEFAIENLASIVTILAATSIPFLLAQLENLRLAFLAFSTSNPLLFLLTSIATAGTIAYDNWDKLSNLFRKTIIVDLEAYVALQEKLVVLKEKLASSTRAPLSNFFINSLEGSRKEIEETKKRIEELKGLSQEQYGPKDDPAARAYAAEIYSLQQKMKSLQTDTKKLKEEFADLNKWFSKTKDIDGYAKKLRELEIKKATQQFDEGKTTLDAYNKAMSAVKVKELNAELTKGRMTLNQFNAEMASERLKVLNAELALGVITLSEFNKEVIKLEDKIRAGSALHAGIEGFIESVGTISEGIAKSVGYAFDQLSVVVADFIRGRTVDFKKFANAVLDDIALMIARAAIVRPIAQGILGLAGGLFSSGVSANTGPFGQVPTRDFANGGIMTSKGPLPLNMYAGGGIANSPQVSMFGEGRTPEAYVPLPDGRTIPVSMDGGGGVSISQTIIINSDGTTSSNNKTNGQNAKELGDMIRKVTMDTILQQRRPGGVLS